MGKAEYIVHFKGDYSALAKDLNKISAEAKKLEDDEVIIKLAYDGNIKEFNKVFGQISKMHPELGIQFQYNVNEKILKQEFDKLQKLTELQLDIDDNKVQGKLENFANNVESALEDGLDKDEIDKRLRKVFGYYNTAMKAGAKNIDFASITDRLFDAFEIESDEIKKIFDDIFDSNDEKPLELFRLDKSINEEISITKGRVDDLKDAMKKLEVKGASKLGLSSDLQEVQDEIKILRSDIEDMQKQLQNLSGEAFDAMTESIRKTNEQLSEALQKIEKLSTASVQGDSKVVSAQHNGNIDESGYKIGESIIESIISGMNDGNADGNADANISEALNNVFSHIVLDHAVKNILDTLSDKLNESEIGLSNFNITFDGINNLTIGIQDALDQKTFDINIEGTIDSLSKSLNTSAENVRLSFLDAVKWMRQANEWQRKNTDETHERQLFFNSKTGQFSNPTVVGDRTSIGHKLKDQIINYYKKQGTIFDTDLHWHQDDNLAAPSPVSKWDKSTISGDMAAFFYDAFKDNLTRFIVGAQKEFAVFDFSSLGKTAEEFDDFLLKWVTDNIDEITWELADTGLSIDDLTKEPRKAVAMYMSSMYKGLRNNYRSEGIDLQEAGSLAMKQLMKNFKSQQNVLGNLVKYYTPEEFEKEFGKGIVSQVGGSSQYPLGMQPNISEDFHQELQDAINDSGKYFAHIYGELVDNFKAELQESIYDTGVYDIDISGKLIESFKEYLQTLIDTLGAFPIEVKPYMRKGGEIEEVDLSKADENEKPISSETISPTQQFDNTIQKDIVYLENYKNTIEEINQLKIQPQTDETERKLEELQKLADYFFGSISITQNQWGNDGGNFAHDPYGTYRSGLDLKGYNGYASEIWEIGKNKEKINIRSLTTEFVGIEEEINRIESKSEGLRNALTKDLTESSSYVSRLRNGIKTLGDSCDILNNSIYANDKSYLKAAKDDIDSVLERFPELLQFKDQFSNEAEANAFIKTDEWLDFLSTLPQAHTYLESIGYDFDKINRASNENNLPTESTEAETKALLSKKEVVEQLRTELNLTKKAAEELFDQQGYAKTNNKYQIEQASVEALIASIKEKQKIEEATKETDSSAIENTMQEEVSVVSAAIESEKKKFDELKNKISTAIPNAIKKKNKAFEKEGSLVAKIVDDEIDYFEVLKDSVDGVTDSLGKQQNIVKDSKPKKGESSDKTSNNKSNGPDKDALLMQHYTSLRRDAYQSFGQKSETLQDMTKYYAELQEQSAKVYANAQDQANKLLQKIDKLKESGKYTQDFVAELNSARLELGTFLQQLSDGNIDFETVDARIKTLAKDIEVTLSKKAFSNVKQAAEKSLTNVGLKIDQIIAKNSAMGKDFETRFKSLRNELDGAKSVEDVQRIIAAVNRLESELISAGQTGKSFIDQIKQRLRDINSKYIAQYFSFQDIIRYARQAVTNVIELNDAFIELSKVSDTSLKSLEADFQSYANIAKTIGGTITDTINATADWARMGYSVPDSKELARVAMLYKNVGDGIDITAANESLISTLQGYQMQADEAEHIVDVFNEVANNYAIDTAGIGEALQRSAASLNAANTSLEESVALVTTANTIAQNPESVGTTFKTLSARIRGATTELEDLGEETDEYTETTSKLQGLVKSLTGFDILKEDQKTYKSIYEILIGIGKEWKNLDDIEQASLGEALAGKRNANVLYAVLNNIETLESAYKTAEDAAGSAQREQENYQKGITYSVNQAKAVLEELSYDAINSDFLKGAVETGTKILNIIDFIVDKVGILKTLIIGIITVVGARKINIFSPENTDSITSFIDGLKKAKGSIIDIGKTLLSTFANGAVSFGISAVVTGIIQLGQAAVNAIDKLIVTSEEAKELSQTFLDSFNDLQSQQSSVVASLDNINDEFIILSQGVNTLGENVNLSEEEFERYHEITKTIADNVPSLVQGYDAHGNAIIRLTDNVNSLTEAYQKNRQEAAYDLYNKTEDDGGLIAGVFKNAEDVLGNGNPIQAYKQLLEMSYADIANGISYDGKHSPLTAVQLDLIKEIGFTATTTEQEYIDNIRPKLYGLVTKYESDANNVAIKIGNAALTYGQTLQSYWEDMTDDERNLFDHIIQGFDVDYIVQHGLYTQDKMEEYVRQTLDQIKELDMANDPHIQMRLDLITQVNNGDITVSEYLARLSELNNWLSSLPDETQKVVSILFNIDSSADEQIQSDKAYLKQLMGDNYSEEALDMFSPDELRNIAKSVSIPNYDKLIKELDIVKNKHTATAEEAEEKATRIHELEEELARFNPKEMVTDWSQAAKSGTLSPEIKPKWDSYTADELKKKIGKDISPIEVEIEPKASSAVDSMAEAKSAIASLNSLYDQVVNKTEADGQATGFADPALINSVESSFSNFIKTAQESGKDVTEMNSALENFERTLVEFPNNEEKAQDAIDELITAYIDQTDIIQNLTETNKEWSIAQLKAFGITNAEEVVETRLAKTNKRLSKSYSVLKESIDNYNDALNRGDEEAKTKELETMAKELNTLYDYKDSNGAQLNLFDTQFVQDNLDLIQQSIDDTSGKFNELDRIASKQYIAKMAVEADDESVSALYGILGNLINDFDGQSIDIGTSMDGGPIFTTLEAIREATKMTVKEFQELVRQATGGTIEANVTYDLKKVSIPYTRTWVTGHADANGNYQEQYQDVKMRVPKFTYQYVGKGKGAKATYTPPTGKTDNTGGSSGGSNGSNSGSENKLQEDTKETFDWIEVKIQRLEEAIARLDKQVGNTYIKWGKRNKSLTDELGKVTEEIKVQEHAQKRYLQNAQAISNTAKNKNNRVDAKPKKSDYEKGDKQYTYDLKQWKKANELWKSGKYQKLIQQGKIGKDDIERIQNKYLVNLINQYKELYQKSVDAGDKVDDLKIKLGDLNKTKFDNIKSEYEGLISLIEDANNLVEERINNTQERGYFVNKKYYQQEIKNVKDERKKKEIEYKKLIKIRDEAVSSGAIEKNSEAWVQMTNDINAAELALLQYDTEIIKLNNDIRQLKWDAFDFGQQRLDRITSETETLIDLLDSLPLYDENGEFTNRGRATEALYGIQYDVAAKKAEEYRKAIKDLEATMDPYDQKAIERLDAMKDGLWEQTKAMEAAKDATKDLIANGIQKHIESLNKLIDKYKQSLSDAKSLYDYQKNIAQQTKNIASLEKQLASYAGDESEESRANIQKLTEQLEEARTGLKETEWDKYISETNDMLDKMTNEYQEYMNKWLEDINAVFKWAVGDVNSHVDEISKTLRSVAGNEGVSLSSQLKSMLQTSTENNTALITAYNKGNAELSSTVEKGLDKIIANAKDITNGEQSGNKKTTTKTTSSNSKSSSQQTENKKKDEYNNKKSQLDNEYKQQVSNINAQITQLEKEEKQKIAALNKDIKNAKTKAEKTDLEKDVSRISEQYDRELASLKKKKETLTQTHDSDLASLRKKYGYASGSHGITSNQLAWTQENGSELIFRKADGAILTPLNRGDMVFTHDMSQALWDIAKNPNIFKQTVNVPNVGTRTINNDNNLTVVLPNVMNYEQFKSAMMSDPKVKNFVQATTIGQALGKGKLNRGNL